MPPVDFVRGGRTGNKSREQIMKKISRAAAARHDDQKMRKGVLEIRRSKERERGAQVEEFREPIYIKLLKYSLHRLERIEGSM